MKITRSPTTLLRILQCSLVSIVLSACSGGSSKNAANTSTGAILITGAQNLQVDVGDLQALGFLSASYEITLNHLSADYQTTTPLQDLTSQISGVQNSSTLYNVTLDKGLSVTYPIVIIFHDDATDTYFQDVLFSGDLISKPGMTSTLAYSLLKNYPNRLLTDYSSSDYHGIKSLIQNRINQMLSESETLSLTSVPYRTLNRYFTNGMAFNPTFLEAIKPFGVNYGYSVTTPSGVFAADAPSGSIASSDYQYATHFTLNGTPTTIAPFNQINTAPRFQSVGAGSEIPGTNIHVFNSHDTFIVQEGWALQVIATAMDTDGNPDGVGSGEYLDKSFIVSYQPRKLPSALPIIVPEPVSEYTTVPSNVAYGSSSPDTYTSKTIAYNEALDLTVFPSGKTATRDVYYLISDGMVRIPYHWSFTYQDSNRPPVIVRDANGLIIDNDAQMASINSTMKAQMGWASMCNPTADQSIHYKSDGPWNCAFRAYDPDLDVDPNAAADQFYFNVTNMPTDAITQSTIINFFMPGLSLPNSLDRAWVASGYPLSSPKQNAASVANGTVMPTCVDGSGTTHYKCGVGIFSVVANNALANAPTVDPITHSINFIYTVQVNDRINTGDNIQSDSQTLNRLVSMIPNSPRLINYSQYTPPNGTASFSAYVNGSLNQGYVRNDMYLSELQSIAGVPLNKIGFSADSSNASTNTFAVASARTPFTTLIQDGSGATVQYPMSPYITQWHKVPEGGITGSGTASSPYVASPSQGYATLLNQAGTVDTGSPYLFSYPFEVDEVCSLQDNNRGASNLLGNPWNQGYSGKRWIFEVDAIDVDNISLAPNEVSDPIYFSFPSDAQAAVTNAGFQFCQTNAPNTDPSVYQTYSGLGLRAAVNTDCTIWTTVLPTQMQPIPVFYNQVIDGVTTPSKTVYHRLQISWTPTASRTDLVGGSPPAFVIQNALHEMKLYGNKYKIYLANTTATPEPLADRSDVTSTSGLNPTAANPSPSPAVAFPFYAARKDMIPCVTLGDGAGTAGSSATNSTPLVDYIHQKNATSSLSINVSVGDPNWSLIKGRAQVEMTLAVTDPTKRNITTPNFYSYVPFIRNCSAFVNASTSLQEPVVWYARGDSADTSNYLIPRTRMTGYSSKITGAGLICMSMGYNPVTDSSTGSIPNTYPYVIQIVNSNNADLSLNVSSFFDNSWCASFNGGSSLHILKDQKYITFASKCPLSSAKGATVVSSVLTLNNANWVATQQTPLDPTAYGFSSSTTPSLDLFPWMYGLTYGTAFSSTLNDLANNLIFNVKAIDAFYLNTTTGLPVALIPDPATDLPTNTLSVDHLAMATPTPSPYVTPPPSQFQFTYVDYNNPLTTIAVPTATPNPASNTYATVSGSLITIYSKSDTAIDLPFQTSQLPGLPASGNFEPDAFDVHTYSLSQVSVSPSGTVTTAPLLYHPNRTPATTGAAANALSDSPSGYPGTLSTLNATSLLPYHQGHIYWAPVVGDEGKTYNYKLKAQHNLGATGATLATMGVGGKFPDGVNMLVPSNSSIVTNTNTTMDYTLQLISYETNKLPTISSVVSAVISGTNHGVYSSSTANVSGWSSLFTSTGHYTDNFSSYSNCPASSCLTIQDGDTIQSDVPVQMIEGSNATSFTVSAWSDRITTSLNTLTPTLPGYVLIADGSRKGQYYKPTGLNLSVTNGSGMSTSSSNIANFTFSWTPTDKDAFYLSNASGFLIPLQITTGSYNPNSVPLKTDPMTTTVWIWAQLKVLNNPPAITYIAPNSAAETTLSGGTLSFQTGINNTYTFNVRDPDVARVQYGNDAAVFTYSLDTSNLPSGFTLTSNPSAAGTMGNPTVVTTPSNAILQSFTLSGSPSVVGGPYPVTMTVTDPGDLSGGYAVNNYTDPFSVIRGALFSGANNATVVSFNIQVVGKPTFLAPSGANPTVYAYASTSFTYPVSMLVSRPYEDNQPFFVGMDVRDVFGTGAPTVAANAVPHDLYIDQTQQLKWATSPFGGASTCNPGNTSSSTSPCNVAPFYPSGSSKTVSLYGTMDYTYTAVSASPFPTPANGGGCITTNRTTCGSTGTTRCDTNTSSYTTLVRWNSTLNSGHGQYEYCHIPAANVSTELTAAQSLTVSVVDSANTMPSITAAQAGPITYLRATNSSLTANQATNYQFADFQARCGSACTVTPTGSYNTVNGAVLSHSATSGTITYTYNSASPARSFESDFDYDETVAGTVTTTNTYKDTSPNATSSVSLSAHPGDQVPFTATLSSAPSPSYLQYHWYVNGCLKSSGLVSSTAVTYTLPVTPMMAGLNNNCTGQYALTESSTSNSVGQLVVRLVVDTGLELNAVPKTDSSETTYVWHVNVVNTQPLLPSPSYLQSGKAISLTSTSYTGSSNSSFAMIVPASYSGTTTDYFTYTDQGSGLRVHLLGISKSGDITTSTAGLTLACTSMTSNPAWLGVYSTGNKMTISASSVNSSGSTAMSLFQQAANNCFGTATSLNGSSTTIAPTSPLTSVTSGQIPDFAAFGQSAISNAANAAFNTTSSAFDGTEPSLNYFLIQNQYSTSKFWNLPLSSASNPSIYMNNSTPWTPSWVSYNPTNAGNSNAVRANILMQNNASTGKLAQLIGASSSSAVIWQGAILLGSISQNGSGATNLAMPSAGTQQITFSYTGGYSGGNCGIDGTPLAGAYISATDTLYVLAYHQQNTANGDPTASDGKILAINNATSGSATCSLVGSVVAPSLDSSVYNPNISKIIFDSTNGVIYGIVTSTTGASQLFSIDALAQGMSVYNVPSNIHPYEVIHSNGTNATYIFDNTRSGSTYPTLYRVW